MGIVGTHPGSFRKSGKHRAYRIRNLEVCTQNGRSSCSFRRGGQPARGTTIPENLEGPREGRSWLEGEKSCRPNTTTISQLVTYVKHYFKWFGFCRIAKRVSKPD